MSNTTSTTHRVRPIDQRFKPPVAGIDLEQALNYIDINDVTENFIYNHYTASRLPYIAGSRPELEAIAKKLIADATSPIEQVKRLTKFVCEEVAWAGYYEQKHGTLLPFNRRLTEEQLIQSRYAWCNEQAQVLCALTQVVGIASRLVFASHPSAGYGHVITECLLPEGWITVDQSVGYLFAINGRPIRACHIYRDPETRAHFQPIYKQLCDTLVQQLGHDLLHLSFRMAVADDPLDGFSAIGYHNHFIH